jgi:hypothetical protein
VRSLLFFHWDRRQWGRQVSVAVCGKTLDESRLAIPSRICVQQAIIFVHQVGHDNEAGLGLIHTFHGVQMAADPNYLLPNVDLDEFDFFLCPSGPFLARLPQSIIVIFFVLDTSLDGRRGIDEPSALVHENVDVVDLHEVLSCYGHLQTHERNHKSEVVVDLSQRRITKSQVVSALVVERNYKFVARRTWRREPVVQKFVWWALLAGWVSHFGVIRDLADETSRDSKGAHDWEFW